VVAPDSVSSPGRPTWVVVGRCRTPEASGKRPDRLRRRGIPGEDDATLKERRDGCAHAPHETSQHASRPVRASFPVRRYRRAGRPEGRPAAPSPRGCGKRLRRGQTFGEAKSGEIRGPDVHRLGEDDRTFPESSSASAAERRESLPASMSERSPRRRPLFVELAEYHVYRRRETGQADARPEPPGASANIVQAGRRRSPPFNAAA